VNRLDADCGELAGRWVLAALLVAALACLFAPLPVAIALRYLDLPAGSVAPIALALALGGALLTVKSVAILRGLAPGAWSASKGAAAEHID
jgi:hypothetical protein